MNRMFHITHDTLIQPVASLIQCISHFSQYKIKPYSPLWVSMMSLPKFFHLSTHVPPSHIFPITHWWPSHGYCISSSFIGCQNTWLIIISHLLIIIPGIHNLTCLCNIVIPINPCSILLKFIFQYIATLYLFLSLYFHVHILCALYK